MATVGKDRDLNHESKTQHVNREIYIKVNILNKILKVDIPVLVIFGSQFKTTNNNLQY